MPHALIIDDDRSNLGVLKELLTMEQITYTALTDSTKVEATLAQGDPVDVVILDLGMPNLNGYQVFEIIRQYPHMANVPVVACTVHTGEAQNARMSGFHSFISKPLNIDQFSNQLARILNGESVWQAY
jgi:two-component system cell cycle response regulator DivK